MFVALLKITDYNYLLFILQIEDSIKTIVLRHGLRLWKLRVLQAELKVKVR